jgi:hypothetical protein
VLGYNYPGSEWYQSAWNDLVSVGAAKGAPVGNVVEEQPGFFTRAWGWVF